MVRRQIRKLGWRVIQLHKVPIFLKNSRIELGLLVVPAIDPLAEAEQLLFVQTGANLIENAFQGQACIIRASETRAWVFLLIIVVCNAIFLFFGLLVKLLNGEEVDEVELAAESLFMVHCLHLVYQILWNPILLLSCDPWMVKSILCCVSKSSIYVHKPF